MIKNMLGKMFFLAALLLVTMLLLFLYLRREDPRLEEAYQHYVQGEQAVTIAERNSQFNAALNLFLTLEQEYAPLFGDGTLYYDIGNSFFQLGNYSEAILFYKKAQKLLPRATAVRTRISLAQKKLFLEGAEAQPNPLASLFAAWPRLSLPERLQLFALLSALFFLASSLLIWQKQIGWVQRTSTYIKGINTALICGLALIGFSLLYTHYFSPLQAVAIEAALLRQGPHLEYPKVRETPVAAGTAVEVLSAAPDGTWFKVLTPKGDFGYVQGKAIRLVD